MASSKLMASSASASSRKSDLRRNPIIRSDPTARSVLQRFRSQPLVMNDAGSDNRSFGKSSTITVVELVTGTGVGFAGDGQTGGGSSGGGLDEMDGALLNADIRLLDAAGAIAPITDVQVDSEVSAPVRKKTAADVWREIVAGGESDENGRVECKEEAVDEMMTLEAFLVKAGAVDEGALMADVEGKGEVKVESALSGEILSLDTPYMSRQGSLDSVGMLGYSDGSVGLVGRGKRRGANLFEPLDKAAQQRQKRMIKNRESAARSRERKQAYQNELESMAVRLEEENEQLLKEKAERTKARRKMLMEKIIPVEEKRKPARSLRRVRSMLW